MNTNQTQKRSLLSPKAAKVIAIKVEDSDFKLPEISTTSQNSSQSQMAKMPLPKMSETKYLLATPVRPIYVKGNRSMSAARATKKSFNFDHLSVDSASHSTAGDSQSAASQGLKKPDKLMRYTTRLNRVRQIN